MFVKDLEDDIVIRGDISILPEVGRGGKTSINYDGILSSSGADKVYLHYGFDGWSNADTVAMNRSLSGAFNTEVKMNGKYEFNFCFKDSANNWDNNNGSDWKVEIE